MTTKKSVLVIRRCQWKLRPHPRPAARIHAL